MSVGWNGDGFPPVGAEIKFWDDESNTYRKGTVVYSGKKGAAVDVGCLLASGEQGDFSLITAEDRAQELAVDAMRKVTGMSCRDAEELYSLIKRNKIPHITLK